MGYSRTSRAIARVKDLLDEMVSSSKSLEWRVEEPHKVAYYIWDAIKYAERSGKKEYKEYAKLKAKYQIKKTSDTVIAALRDEVGIVRPLSMVIRGITDVLEVIGAAIEHQKKQMSFPDANLSDDDQAVLQQWCDINGYELKFVEGLLQLEKSDEGEENGNSN